MFAVSVLRVTSAWGCEQHQDKHKERRCMDNWPGVEGICLAAERFRGTSPVSLTSLAFAAVRCFWGAAKSRAESGAKRGEDPLGSGRGRALGMGGGKRGSHGASKRHDGAGLGSVSKGRDGGLGAATKRTRGGRAVMACLA